MAIRNSPLLPRLALLAGMVVFASEGNARSATPNILLILADDLGWADLGCYGNAFNETPHLDRLAEQGARFTQFYADPACSPSRASVQTGQYPARFGITVHIPGHWRPFARMVEPPVALNLPLEAETFAERLKSAGYVTGYFGKWHLGDELHGPVHQGWDVSLVLTGNSVPDTIDDSQPPRRTAEFITERALDFIDGHRDRPFLLQLSHFAVHIPLSTTPSLQRKYERKPALPGYPSNPTYAGLLHELDDSVGRIVSRIDELGLGERTLIVFVSDNGALEVDFRGRVITENAPLRGEKGMLYEGGIRVPFIARWTGRIAPGEVNDPAHLIDLYPTFMELAQVLPLDRHPPDGQSLIPALLHHAADSEPRTLYWHLPHYHHDTPGSALRHDDWKLIERFEDASLELYNLADDPGERRNLSDREPARAAALRERLMNWRREVQAQLPRENPGHDVRRETERWNRRTVSPMGP